MQHSDIERAPRFDFGSNWNRFLSRLDDNRIASAELSIQEMLRVEHLEGKTFLDMGCGSGLFSLCARRLGASVHSFDFDPKSVDCARELKRRYRDSDPLWTIEEGDVLDATYLEALGEFDIVYSWGVLHHTGDLWQALANAAIPAKANGLLFISIYNDQGLKSRLWSRAKRFYCSGLVGRLLTTAFGVSVLVFSGFKEELVRGRNPLRRYREYYQRRGMSAWNDMIDWLGGHPFEVAKPEDVVHFYYDCGFLLTRLKTEGGGSGTNQFIFQKSR